MPTPQHSRCPLTCLAIALLWPALATAQTAPPVQSSPSFAADLLAVVLPVVLIIAGLVAVLYVLRRRYGLTARDAPLSIVQILPVGPRERIVVVRTRSGRAFAVGVGGQSLNLITELFPDDLVPDDVVPDGQAPNKPGPNKPAPNNPAAADPSATETTLNTTPPASLT